MHGMRLSIIVVCGVFKYNISAKSPARNTPSLEHGLSTGGGVSIYKYIEKHKCVHLFMCNRVCMPCVLVHYMGA